MRARLPAIVGSLLAFTVYGWLLRVAPLPLVATYAYVNPVVAVILGAIVLGEPIDAAHRRRGRRRSSSAVALIVTARGRMTPDAARPSRAAPAGAARPSPSSRRPDRAEPRRQPLNADQLGSADPPVRQPARQGHRS